MSDDAEIAPVKEEEKKKNVIIKNVAKPTKGLSMRSAVYIITE